VAVAVAFLYVRLLVGDLGEVRYCLPFVLLFLFFLIISRNPWKLMLGGALVWWTASHEHLFFSLLAQFVFSDYCFPLIYAIIFDIGQEIGFLF
jgi:hypothetical protein